jgi:hypothetical protein
MSSTLSRRPETTFTDWTVLAVASATGVVTYDPPLPTTYTLRGYVGNPVVTRARVGRVVDIPLTCDAIYEFDASNFTGWEWDSDGFVPLTSNPDIAGFGVSDLL